MNTTDDTETIHEKAIDCYNNFETMKFDDDNGYFADNLYCVPMTCTVCGRELEYVYEPFGIYSVDKEDYVKLI